MDGIRAVRAPVPRGLRVDRFHRLWYGIYLPWAIRRHRIAIFHSPSFWIPATRWVPRVATFHHLCAEEIAPWPAAVTAGIDRAAAEADAIIVDSEHGRRAVVERFPAAAGRIEVVHLGVSRALRPPTVEDVARVRARYGLPPRFVLHVGGVYPRKNVGAAVRAVAILRGRGLPHTLVCAGPVHDQAVLDQDTTRALGYVPAADLAGLYGAAEAFVFPSLDEGFGFPPLEAAACGLPSVVTTRGAVPEVMGDAALYADPEDPEAIAGALERILMDPALRSDLAGRARRRAAAFSWDVAADRIMAIYERAIVSCAA